VREDRNCEQRQEDREQLRHAAQLRQVLDVGRSLRSRQLDVRGERARRPRWIDSASKGDGGVGLEVGPLEAPRVRRREE
jgi:hypothetical protein